MANENEEILQNNNETEGNETQTTIIGDKLRKISLGGCNTVPSQPVATTNGDATDNSCKPTTKFNTPSTAATGALGDYKNIRATTTSAIHSETHTQQPVRREENPFSFKHFLNREPSSSSSATSSSFVISTTPLSSERDSAVNNNDTGTTSSSTTTMYQTSTGARPKVPQSSSSSLIGGNSAATSTGGNGNVSNAVPTESSKMKRSPRFSSFDSQASLAEYAATGSGMLGGVSGSSSSAGINTRSSPSFRISQNTDDDASSAAPKEDLLAADPDRQQFVPRRSYSNYDIEVQPSPRRRVPDAARPARGFPKPQISQNHHSSTSNPNQRPPNPEFAAAALPDFVQDHWMDAWYCNEMNLHSPPNSPNSPIDFVEDITGGVASSASAGSNTCQGADTKCQTLPDFLSDGPIIHSSQRLADVAAGLPAAANWSNMDSPEDDSPSLQLSRLRLENERLCIELNETRQALGEQTRRTNELERSLEQARSMESAYNRTMAQNIGLVEEDLDQSKKRTIAAENQVAKLNLQVKQLTAEVNGLRKENESLRDGGGDGAVGGRSNNEQRSTAASSSSRNRPSRSLQISRELQRAAATAESNLRQLLAGVDNLRQLAADIENTDSRFEYDDSFNSSTYPPMSDDFVEGGGGGDDYDDYTGGPSL
ncbi:uncharacterized protein LOC129939155 [Eupeodes corollae]|uniref:uncharacterized protein LOC129939155 n=1 Tax=Eupeodes corollae TaxID=290404 RepID=UPI002490B0BC|nr:uncharacterized protein LOC129939155 [Eupeodes corollae]